MDSEKQRQNLEIDLEEMTEKTLIIEEEIQAFKNMNNNLVKQMKNKDNEK